MGVANEASDDEEYIDSNITLAPFAYPIPVFVCSFIARHQRVPKLCTIVDTRIFYHIYWKIFSIPIFSSGFLKFCSGLFI